ncbi:MAG: cupin domain-containing protein [Candidatus Tyrphobacter sp.]
MNFTVLQTGDASQTASMTLAPGESSGPKSNEHPDSEQVLYLIDGELQADVGDRRFIMRAGDSVIVPKDANHRFTNAGTAVAMTFNVYAPPAYEATHASSLPPLAD